MSLLAYQPERLAALRAAMQRALAELQATVCWDADAQAAMVGVRAASARLGQDWLPLVTRILESTALTEGQLRAAGLDEATNSLAHVMHRGYGWAVQHDARADDETTVTPEEARALGARLNTLDPKALLDHPEEMRWVARQLEIIARDPVLLAAFLDNFHGWADLCNALAYERIAAAGPRYVGAVSLDDIDALFHGLAAVRAAEIGVTVRCVEPSDALPDFEALTPYAAAMLARDLGLDSTTFAALSALILDRWVNAPAFGSELDEQWPGPNTADLLFEVLVADPEAATAFVHLAATHDLSILFQTADDPALAQHVALVGTSGVAGSPAVIGDSVTAIIEWFSLYDGWLNPVSPTYPAGWNLFLADLIAPWTMQFSPANDDWGIDATVRRDLLAFVLEDEAALLRMLEQADAVTAGVAATLQNTTESTLEEVVAYLSLLSNLVVNKRIADEEARAAAWEMWWTVIDVAAGVVGGVASLSVVGAFVVDLGVIGAEDLLSRWAPDPERVADDQEYAHSYRMVVVGASLAWARYAGWIEAGLLPATAPPPPSPDPSAAGPVNHFLDALNEWMADLPGGADGDLADEVRATVYMAVNPEDRGAELAG